MIIVWRRWGILVPIIFILGAVGAQQVFHPIGRVQSIYFFIPAAIILPVGILLDKKQKVNDFFFIPSKYWSIILSVFGAVIWFTG
jgi:hypothetical protein